MNGIMCLSVWLISSVTLVFMDLRSSALLQKDEPPRRCFVCGLSNNTSTNATDCGQQSSASLVQCPTTRPYCATIASTLDWKSSLDCTEASDKLCSLTYHTQKQTYEIICVCKIDQCNAPFSRELRQKLLNFVSSGVATKNNSSDFSDLFFQHANITKTSLYDSWIPEATNAPTTIAPNRSFEAMTVRNTTATIKKYSGNARHTPEIHAPRGEALKQEVTAPTDDDEDEGEGSGSFEESRSPKRPVSAPAAPSSFLPADENRASLIYLSNIVVYSLFVFVIV